MRIDIVAATKAPSRVLMMSAASLALAVLMGFSALIKIPLLGSPVPITLQTFVLFAGAGLLRKQYAVQMVMWYLLLGMLGAPFFVGGGGWHYVFGATGGYLIGFILAAALIGYGGRPARRWWTSASLYIAAAAIIYIPGLVVLKLATGAPWIATLTVGLVPFIAFDIVKAAAAFAAVKSITS